MKYFKRISDELLHQRLQAMGAVLIEDPMLIVLTGGKVGLRRKDGVYVIPIGCLKD